MDDLNELPLGWIRSDVESLFDSFSGGTPSKSIASFWNGSIPWVSSGDVKAATIDGVKSEKITEEGLRNSSAKLCNVGAVIIVVRSGVLKHTLPVAIATNKVAINQDIKCFDSGNASLNKWLSLSLRNETRQILELNREGTTVQSVKYETLKAHGLKIPPLNEQKRIVEKLEKLLGKVEAAQERLDKIPVILKRFRQSVLAAACSGKLTTDWRESKEINLETELPTDWTVESVGSVIEDLKYGTSQKCGLEVKGVPVLRIPNIGEWFVDKTNLKYAVLPSKEFNQLKLAEGDILLIRSNGSVSLVGKTAIVRHSEKEFAYAGYLIRLRPDTEIIYPEFFNYVLGSYDVRVQIEIPARSTSGVNNINSTEVKALLIPLPPLDEQKEIVRRVDELFKFADQIEERYKKARSYTDKLAQSILAKAFRGELVPQDPNDEPASKLLANTGSSEQTQ
ncbi:hypothetical protein BH20ACI2_BH20ACI2_23450 [soil metagenome]